MTKDERTLKAFRHMLARTLKRRKLSQRAAAELSGVSHITICRILKGRMNPRHTDAVRLQELDAE